MNISLIGLALLTSLGFSLFTTQSFYAKALFAWILRKKVCALFCYYFLLGDWISGFVGGVLVSLLFFFVNIKMCFLHHLFMIFICGIFTKISYTIFDYIIAWANKE